jgi:catechol 2,3-dioxygenase-like lactoylglutathione lyase family enzyme
MNTPDPNSLILYVRTVAVSERFYAALLGRAAVESSPNFAMFRLDNGTLFGLWAAHDVAPAATAPGGVEIAFALADKAAVTACHARWSAQGLAFAQAPTAMDFGYTFVALDPDGHRLRVFTPS